MELLYADDTVWLSDDPDLLQKAINRQSDVIESMSLRVNLDWTKVTVFYKEENNLKSCWKCSGMNKKVYDAYRSWKDIWYSR